MATFSYSRSADSVVIKYAKDAAGIGVATGLGAKPVMFSGTTATVPNSQFTSGEVYLIGAYASADGSGTPTDTDWYVANPGAQVQIPGAAAGGSLVDACAASLALTDPPKGCEGAKAVHDNWLSFLEAVFSPYPNGIPVKDNRLARETLEGPPPQTTCSQTLSNFFRNFGIPREYWSKNPLKWLVPLSSAQTYIQAVTPDHLPRVGDPYIIGPGGGVKDNHHAVFGPWDKTTSTFWSYAGGQSSPKSANNPVISDGTIDAKRYSCTLKPGKDSTKIQIGERQLLFFTDMWAFFRDHGQEKDSFTSGVTVKNPPQNDLKY